MSDLMDDCRALLSSELEAKDAEIERLKLDWMAESSQNRAKIERLNTLATDAITYLTDEIGVGDDPVAFVCAAYVESRRRIALLNEVVEAARMTVKECAEMEFDHSNSCYNWALCEDSRRQCALCDLRDIIAKLDEST